MYPGKWCGLKFVNYKWMKKKENLWQLLKRLDEEAGQFNMTISEANRYFDSTEKKTKKLLQKHEKDLHKTIGKLKNALKMFIKKKGTK